MRAKDYLSQVAAARARIQRIERRIARLEDQHTSITAVTYDADPVQVSNDGQGFTRLSDMYVDYQRELQEKILKYEKIAEQIETEIYALSDQRYAELLASKYVDGQSLSDIAVSMGYDYDWVRHLHGWALKAFQEEILDKKTALD